MNMMYKQDGPEEHGLLLRQAGRAQTKVTLSNSEGFFTKLAGKIKTHFKEKKAARVREEELHTAVTQLGAVTAPKVCFVEELHSHTGLSLPQIGETIKKLLSLDAELKLSVDEILSMEAADFSALFNFMNMERIQSMEVDEIYDALPASAASQVNIWLEKMRGTITPPPPPAAGAAAEAKSIESILQEYVRDSVVILAPKEMILSFKMFKISLYFAGGRVFPVDEILMTVFWSKMQAEMREVAPAPENLLKEGFVFMSSLLSMESHILKEGISSAAGKVMKLITEVPSDSTKECFFSFYEAFGGNAMNAKKYLGWHNTVGVLIENEKVDMPAAMRMMSTFTMGKSFARILLNQVSFKKFLKELSPVPSARTINDLLVLFRSTAEYKSRTEEVLKSVDGIVKGEFASSDIEKAFIAYRDFLKLKVAFLPDYGYGQRGEIYDPDEVHVDDELIDLITNYAFSKKTRTPETIKQWSSFKAELRHFIGKTVDKAYFEYFGQPSIPPKQRPYGLTSE